MAFVVPESRARANLTAVLDLLEGVTHQQAERKLEQCTLAAPALSYSTDIRPTDRAGAGAATHLLSELCQVAGAAEETHRTLRPRGLDMRCLLLPG